MTATWSPLVAMAAMAALVVLVSCSGADPAQPQARQLGAQPESNSPQRTGESQPLGQSDSQESGHQDIDNDRAMSPSGRPADGDRRAPALAAISEWIQNLNTARFEVQVDLEHAGAAAALSTQITLQRSPIAVWATSDLSQIQSFLELLEGDEERTHDEAESDLVWHWHELLVGERLYATVSGSLLGRLPPFAGAPEFEGQPQFPGWLEMSSRPEEPGLDNILSVILSLVGIGPAEPTYLTSFVGLEQFDRVFSCIEEFGGTVVEETVEAEPVWVLECSIGGDTSFSEAAGRVTGLDIEPDPYDEPQLRDLRFRLVVSQHTGAPRLSETVWRYRLPGEEDDHLLSGALWLRDWNQPVELPEPGPPADALWFDAVNIWVLGAEERRRGPFFTYVDEPRIPYGFAANWAAAVDELSVEYSSTLLVGGERYVASTSIRSSHSQLATESESHYGDGSVSRLIWTEDGFWVSKEAAEDDPDWAPSDPALHGFGHYSLEEFLSSWSRINLEQFNPQGRLEGTVRAGPASAGRNAKTLRLSSGRLRAGGITFELVSDALRGLVSELLGVDVEVDEIVEYTTTVHYRHHTGEILSLIATSTFVADGMPAELVVRASVDASGGIGFSDPLESR